MARHPSPVIAVDDYGAGNLRSVAKALERSGLAADVTSEPAAVRDADAVVIFECGRHVRPMEDTNLHTVGPEIVCHGGAIRWMD